MDENEGLLILLLGGGALLLLWLMNKGGTTTTPTPVAPTTITTAQIVHSSGGTNPANPPTPPPATPPGSQTVTVTPADIYTRRAPGYSAVTIGPDGTPVAPVTGTFVTVSDPCDTHLGSKDPNCAKGKPTGAA